MLLTISAYPLLSYFFFNLSLAMDRGYFAVYISIDNEELTATPEGSTTPGIA